jgi:3-hydroxyacyl-CoA dehydrogenase
MEMTDPLALPLLSRRSLRRAAVLGAGTMGAQLAAHFANVGVPVLLLDQTTDMAREGFDRARLLKPSPLFAADLASLVTPGSFDTDLDRLADADWILEAIVERLDAKRALMARVDAVRRHGSIVSSNTSGLSIRAIGEGRSADFQRHWLGTHFFNPPRYLHLVEVIPTSATDPDRVDFVRHVLDRRLGKGVVVAKDTPGFIANHLGMFAMMLAVEALAEGRYTIDEVDAITGAPLGRPKSATFRTMDIAGLDVVGHVTRDLHERLPEADRHRFRTPALLDELISRGWIGEKSGQGFYKREKSPDGSSIIYVIDPGTLSYRPSQRPTLASLSAGRRLSDPRDRVRELFAASDKAGAYLRETLPPFLMYAAHVAGDIAYSIDDVDRAMQWGFGWELGPFELFDTLGVQAVVDAWRQTRHGSASVPSLVAEVLDTTGKQFRAGPLSPAGPDLEILRAARRERGVVRSNSAASLVDIGDGVLCVELHSKMNVIGGDTLAMLQAGVEEAERRFAALVIASDAPDFSAGADLTLLLLEARDENWDEIDLMIRRFQHATTRLRHAAIPIVVAPAGLTLGGGCEIALHASSAQAAAETYIGLVETAVGLIPAGGGTKEMLARVVESLPGSADISSAVRSLFETIGLARRSGSAREAVTLGFLRQSDGITMNRDRLLSDAKERALAVARTGYSAAPKRTSIRVGGEGVLAGLTLGLHLAHRAGHLSDHDVVVGRKLAWVLAGGNLPHETIVSEDYLLDLEREAFLSLCGEPKTLDRIQHTLAGGKALRN